MIDHGKQNVLGVAIDAVDYEASVDRIIRAAKAKEPLAVSATAVHGLMEAVKDPTHRHRINELELVVPDGQPVRWAMALLYGIRLPDRVYGPTLMLKTCEAAAANGLSVYLFGGTSELLARLRANLERQFPDLNIVRTRPSRFRTLDGEEKAELIADIAQSGADVVMVGLGCPRQEVWAYEFKEEVRRPILAVGAAFNFHAGQLDQAPSRVGDWGLEWAYRLVKEPRRLWRRYLVLNPYYLSLLARQRAGRSPERFELSNTVPPTEELLYG